MALRGSCMEILEVGGSKYLKISWRRLEELIEALAEKIIASSYNPDILVGILRGGATVAHLLSDVLGLYRIYPIGCSSYIDVGKKEELKIYSPLAIKDLSGKRVLVVDDVADDGGTLKGVVEFEILPRNPLEVKTATLHMKPWCRFKPDYYVEVTDAWIIYPWEKHEVVRQVAKKFIEDLGWERGLAELAGILGKEVKETEKLIALSKE
ncbi:MAG TPA: phosphoribosyltransferase [Nitrososphaeria archaeon]|nr:MAG: phosphoribosyltransferase [Nitrososphaerota archaeon]HDJ67150.1 phosphoribosyltransferase [Nitrososphaeria archaeon]